MVAKSLATLIDEAMIPASAMVGAKILGVFLVANLIQAEFNVQFVPKFLFLPTFSFENLSQFLMVNSYSNLAMYLVIAAGGAWLLVQAHFFHASHISPKLHTQLIRLGLEGLIVETFVIYHRVGVWIAFLWLVTILILVQAFFGLTYGVLAIVIFLVTVNTSWFFIADVESEIQIWKKTHI